MSLTVTAKIKYTAKMFDMFNEMDQIFRITVNRLHILSQNKMFTQVDQICSVELRVERIA